MIAGAACVLSALLCRSAGGAFQETVFQGVGVPISELLFARSLLGLPALALQWPAIVAHARHWTREPMFFGLLAALVSFDYATKVCVTKLIGKTSSLTATMVLTFQRFVSFVISSTLLSTQKLSGGSWLGAVVVLAGALAYATAPKPGKASAKQNV